MATYDDKERLLSILDAHGRQFLSAFDAPAISKRETSDSDGSEFEKEWTGLESPSDNSGFSGTTLDDEHGDDDDFVAGSSRTPDVMTFQEPTRKTAEAGSSTKELRRSFMSSKVSNITLSPRNPTSKRKIPDEESDDECTNAQNDAILHRLVHTKLLAGSLNPELHLNQAQRGRALAGRVLELVGEAKLGKGENVFRQEQRDKAAKRVRDGLVRKQKEREQKALEEAKNLGTYHPMLKRSYGSKSSSAPKKRARGLGMGVGTFTGGVLKLSREEIASVAGSVRRPQNAGHRGPRQRPR